jgi:hypothetical protein
MPFNLLLLPLLGGLFFVRRCTRTRYYALRSEGYVLLFYGAAAGAVFLVAASVIVTSIIPLLGFLSTYGCAPSRSVWFCTKIDCLWHVVAPFEHSGKAMLAGLIGAFAWIPFNHLSDDRREIDRIVMDRGDPLEIALRTALGNGKPIMLSIKSGKVYVGIVSAIPNPAFPLESVLLLPLWSGHRDDQTKTVKKTTPYPIDAYLGIEDKIRGQLQAEHPNWAEEQLESAVADYIDTKATRFEIVIVIDEIQSMNSFDQEVYDEYFLRLPKKDFKPYRP